MRLLIVQTAIVVFFTPLIGWCFDVDPLPAYSTGAAILALSAAIGWYVTGGNLLAY